jgi:hypothetical protein
MEESSTNNFRVPPYDDHDWCEHRCLSHSVTALMATCSYGSNTFYKCEPVDSYASLNAVKPAGTNLTMGPIGVYAMISSTQCYVLNLNQPGLEQQYSSLFQDHKNAVQKLGESDFRRTWEAGRVQFPAVIGATSLVIVK